MEKTPHKLIEMNEQAPAMYLDEHPEIANKIKNYKTQEVLVLSLAGAGIALTAGSLICRLYQNHNKK